jgi:hypothetical protein
MPSRNLPYKVNLTATRRPTLARSESPVDCCQDVNLPPRVFKHFHAAGSSLTPISPEILGHVIQFYFYF